MLEFSEDYSYTPVPRPESEEGRMKRLFARVLHTIPWEKVNKDHAYEFFDTKGSREDIYNIGKNLASYVHESEIPNVVFLDRAARPAYLALREYWHYAYPQEKLPHLYFMSPKGFETPEDLVEPGPSGMPRLMEDLYKASERGEAIEDPYHARKYDDIMKDVENTYRRLVKDKEKPVLLFDNCIHTGDSVGFIGDTLADMGFEDVRVGVASEDRNFSGIHPEFRALPYVSEFHCYPFDQDSVIEKTYASVTAKRSNEPGAQEYANALRDEVRRVMKEQIQLHSQQPHMTKTS